jgi:hypothetical protein
VAEVTPVIKLDAVFFKLVKPSDWLIKVLAGVFNKSAVLCVAILATGICVLVPFTVNLTAVLMISSKKISSQMI